MQNCIPGKPIDTLTSDDPAVSEKEAIMRGDVALRDNNIDLALYEYIRSPVFSEQEFCDKTLFTIRSIHSSRVITLSLKKRIWRH